MAELRTEARFPDVPEARGHYESFYLRACHPSEPLGVWIRYTVLKRPGQQPRGSLWFTLFDGSGDGEPVARKVTLDPGDVGVEPDTYIRMGEARFEPGRAAGAALDASWELTYEAREPSLRHLPSEWMYRAPVPRTKLLSPYPGAVFSGTVTAGQRRVELDGWRGMVGHNWGAQHAERWIWMHGLAFDGAAADGTWIDAAIGRIKVGGWTTPWIANGELCLGGKRLRLGGLERTRQTRVAESPE
ncbi:MAG TPA: hypothetical protein VF545_12225, partial [Thermoleophilaceae bacterium]